MIKPYHILVTLFIGVVIGILIAVYWPSPDQTGIEDPIIHQLKEEIGWREFKETKKDERIKKDSLKIIALSLDVINERSRFKKSEVRLTEVLRAIPLTRKDTIDFLKRDTAAYDTALLRCKELTVGLTKVVKADSVEILRLDSLNNDLKADKKDFVKIDSLHHEKEKGLEKKSKKNFWKGIKWGALFIGAAELAWKLAILLL